MERKAKQNLIKILFLLITSQIQTATSETIDVQCWIFDDIKNCTITGLTLNMKNYTFKPVARQPSVVVGFEIKKSTVPVITSEICSTLPKILSFVAIQQGIQIIEDYAFNNCTEITLISMPFNNIHTLGKGIFDNTKKLQEINMHGGSLEQIDVDLFNNLGELLELVISANKLKELPVAAVKNLKKLKILYLYSNELSDLDADGLISNLPSLKAVYINDNNLHCDRLNEIIEAFKAKKILSVDHTHSIYLKKRDYIPHKIQEIICLTNVELESEKLKRGLSLSLDEMKDYPLAKAVVKLKDIVSSGFVDADANIVTLFNMLNGTSNDINAQLVNLNRTLNDTTRKMQEMADAITSMADDYKKLTATLSDNSKLNSSSNMVISIVVLCSLLAIVVVAFVVHEKFRRNRFGGVPFSYHNRNSDTVPLNDE